MLRSLRAPLPRASRFTAHAAACAAACLAGAAHAQGMSHYYDPQPAAQESDEIWYEPQQWSTSEWYDDQKQPVEEWRNADYDYGYIEDEDAFRRYDYDGYRAGYYDGYHRLDSAFNQTADASPIAAEEPRGLRAENYRNAYVDGYQDGSYDQQKQFPADPYYYVYVADSSDAGKASDLARKPDNSRARGDRCNQFTRRGTDAYKTDRATHRQRLRGDLADIARVNAANAPGDHTLARLTFQDGRTAIADLGPNMTLAAFPAQPGDRLTIVGREMEQDGQPLFITSRIIVAGEKFTLRGLDPDARPGESPHERERRFERTRANGQITLRGQIAELRQMDEEDFDNPDEIRDEDPVMPNRTFARLRLQDGQTATLLLPGDLDVDDLPVSTGDQVTVRGTELLVNSRTVIQVRTILVNGRPLELTDD
jgi:hypothetical protein